MNNMQSFRVLLFNYLKYKLDKTLNENEKT